MTTTTFTLITVTIPILTVNPFGCDGFDLCGTAAVWTFYHFLQSPSFISLIVPFLSTLI